MPKRIQMTRQKPWRAEHPDAVIVARPSKWGNPFQVGKISPMVGPGGDMTVWMVADRGDAVTLFRHYHQSAEYLTSVRAELAGRDLACWCPLEAPCHGDVLLEFANGGDR